MKTNSSFKLDRSLKRMLCLMNNRQERSEFKKLFIEAQLSEMVSKKKSIKNEKDENE